MIRSRGTPRLFCGLKLTQFLEPSLRNEYKITNTKLGMKVNIYLGPIPQPWKGPVQVRHPEA
jgi:hypothetical protein